MRSSRARLTMRAVPASIALACVLAGMTAPSTNAAACTDTSGQCMPSSPEACAVERTRHVVTGYCAGAQQTTTSPGSTQPTSGSTTPTASSGGTPTQAASSPAVVTSSGNSPPRERTECIAPFVIGRTLAAARAVVRAAHCELGRVTVPTRLRRQHSLVVVSEHPHGTAVDVVLGLKRRR